MKDVILVVFNILKVIASLFLLFIVTVFWVFTALPIIIFTKEGENSSARQKNRRRL